MKSDEFKKQVERNRDAFDVYDTDAKLLWQGIEQRIEQRQRFNWQLWGKVAAAIALVAIAFVSWIAINNQNNMPQQVMDMEAYYGPLTSEKLHFIKTQKDIDPAIFQDLDTLDKTYAQLKEDLKDNVDNEEVVNAMIQTYRTKLKILEQILDEIQNDKEDNEHKDEVVI